MADRGRHAFDELVEKRRAADQAHRRVDELRGSYGPPTEHQWTERQSTTYETALRAWRDLDREAQSAVREYADEQGRPPQQVRADVETAAGRPAPE